MLDLLFFQFAKEYSLYLPGTYQLNAADTTFVPPPSLIDSVQTPKASVKVFIR